MMRDIDENESRAVDLMREIKNGRGHGVVRVEISGHVEKRFTIEAGELAPLVLERGVLTKRQGSSTIPP